MWSEEKSKIAPRCGEKHILKRKCTKNVSSEALFALAISKNCTLLWRKADFEVKMYKKNVSSEELFVLAISKNYTPLWRKADFEVKMYKTRQFRSTF